MAIRAVSGVLQQSKLLARCLIVSGSAWGAGLGISLAPTIRSLPASDVAPSLAALKGENPSSAFYLVIAVLVLSTLGALFARYLGRRINFESAQRAKITILWFLILLWGAMGGGSFAVLSLGGLLGGLALSNLRSVEFGSSEILLLPLLVLAMIFLFEIDPQASPGSILVIGIGLTGLIRLIGGGYVRDGEEASCLVFTPLLVLLTTDLRYEQGSATALFGLTLLILFTVIGVFAIRNRVILRAKMPRIETITLVVFLLGFVRFLYVSPVQTVNLFEHGFDLLPAFELLRGERLYADILPSHGILSDALIDYAGLRLNAPTFEGALEARLVASFVTPLAMFWLGTVLGRSRAAGLLGALAFLCFFPPVLMAPGELSAPLNLRVGPSVAALAAVVGASNSRSARHWSLAAFLVVLALMMSVDFGVYSLIAFFVALFCKSAYRDRRVMVWTLAGFAAGGLFFLALIVRFGELGAFVSVMKILPTLVKPYSLGMPSATQLGVGQQSLPAVLVAPLVNKVSFLVVGWFLSLFFVLLMVFDRELRSRFGFFLAPFSWILASAMSLGERHHLYFGWVLVPALVAFIAIARLELRGSATVIISSALLLVAVRPGYLLLNSIPWAMHSRAGEEEATFVEYPAAPIAGRVWFERSTLPHLELLRVLLNESLNEGETFFSFTNLPILHPLFGYDFPLQLPELAMYETIDREHRLTKLIKTRSDVPLVLDSFPYWSDKLDGVPNSSRLPVAWSAVEARYPEIVKRGLVTARLELQSGPDF